MRIPSQLIVMDLVGTLLAAVGLAGLFLDMSHVIPAFKDRNLAGMVAGVGFALMTFSVLKIVRILRARQTQSPGGSQ
jgi:hypothetical protein